MAFASGRELNRWIDRRRTIFPAELEALEGAALGETKEQTARRLWKSPHTVGRQLVNVRRKLGARTVGQAVAFAVARGYRRR